MTKANITALRTSPAGERSPSEKNGIFSAFGKFLIILITIAYVINNM